MDLSISKILLGSSFLLLFNVFLGCECLNLHSGTSGGNGHLPFLVVPLCILKLFTVFCNLLIHTMRLSLSGETVEPLPVPKGPPREVEKDLG